jgi:class 3 adenylate cyclase/DNA-binding CsgD family transcriptional regulator
MAGARTTGRLPTGTVTFLLTDVEGSTRLWEEEGERMGAAVRAHFDIVHDAIARHGGVRPLDQGEGDSVAAAFSCASDALAAALTAQRRLPSVEQSTGVALRTRMALHTAEAQLRDERNYFGAALGRCARIRSLADGGVILLSRPTRDLVVDRLPEGASLIDVGVHELRGLRRPEHVFALAHPDLIPASLTVPSNEARRASDAGEAPDSVRADAPVDGSGMRRAADVAAPAGALGPVAGVKPVVVGREETLAELEDFVAALVRGPASLVIEGEPGIGKTTVWQAAVDAAVRRGYRVLVSRPAESEVELAYAGIADLLARVDDSVFDGLPAPQRQALEVALLRSEGTGRPPQPRAVFTALGGVLRAIARAGPVLVAVDDLQWLDGSSLRALEFVWRRLVDEPVGLLASARIDAARPSSLGPALRLAPLSAGALHGLIKTRAGVSLPRPTVLRMHRITGGNPFYALELADVLLSVGLPEASDAWPVPDDLREIVTARLSRLPDDARSALLAAAASARPTIAGLDTAALGPAEVAGIVTIDGDGRVRFSHPLFGSAVYESATAAERRRVHRLLACKTDDVEEQARHLALACEGPDLHVAELLDQAAEAARGRGAPDVAAELAERSFELTPPDRSGQAWARRLTAAEHHFHAGDFERARDVLAGLVETADRAPGRSKALRLMGETRFRLGLVDDALRWLRQAVDAAAGEPRATAMAEMSCAFVHFYAIGDFAEAAAAARRALTLAEGLDDRALLASALAAVVHSEVMTGGGLDRERLEHALALEDPEDSGPVERRPSMLVGLALYFDERFDEARVVLDALCARLVERGEESDLPSPLFGLAIVHCLAGEPATSRGVAERACEIARQAGNERLVSQSLAIGALACAVEGRVDDARAAAAEATEGAIRGGWPVGVSWASTALGQLELALGNDDAALAALARWLERAEEDGVADLCRRPFLADAIEALVRVGDLARAEHVTAMLEHRARALDRPAASVAAARSRALIGAARGDVEGALRGLDGALAEHPDVAMPLELARALLVKGQLERRRKHKRHAAESLRHALAICEQIGATLWAQRVRDERARLGRVADPDALTATEGQVARLAARGLTNREIAATAFLSPKTVEANISRIYRKLGIHSRAELGAWSADRERHSD